MKNYQRCYSTRQAYYRFKKTSNHGANSMDNARRVDRCPIREETGRQAATGMARCCFDFDNTLMGMLVDLSPKGFGIEIPYISGSQVEKIKSMDNYMITVDFGDEKIMVSVKNKWNTVRFEDSEMIYRCGVEIDVISPEDRLTLSNIIEKIRSNR